MLRTDLVVKKEEAKEYPLLPKGSYQVEILDINEADAIGKFAQPGDTNFKIQYVILEGKNGDEDLRGRMIFDNFIPTKLYISKKTGKNNLYKVIEATLKREITREEEMGDFVNGEMLNGLIGKQLQVYITHKISGDKTFANVMDWLPSSKDAKPLTEEEKSNYNTDDDDNAVTQPTDIPEGEKTLLSEDTVMPFPDKTEKVELKNPLL